MVRMNEKQSRVFLDGIHALCEKGVGCLFEHTFGTKNITYSYQPNEGHDNLSWVVVEGCVVLMDELRHV